MLNKLYHKGAEIKSAFLNGVMVFGSSDVGLAKDYSGTGWYKASDTGVVYNKDVPVGETYTFEGDPIEYVSVWYNEVLDLETFEGTEEDIQKLRGWHGNLHRFATSNVTDMSYWVYFYGNDAIYDELNTAPDSIDLSHYDTSSVTSMVGMFANAETFNQPLDNFDTSNVTSMDGMFTNAETFNQDLSGWCVPHIEESPISFDNNTPNWTLPKPVWGTCPRGENTLD